MTHDVVLWRDLLLETSRDGHDLMSAWNLTASEPFVGSYTLGLCAAVRALRTAAVLMLGLGGGVLAALLAREGVRCTAVERDPAVVASYHKHFAPAYAHLPMHRLSIEVGDASETRIAGRAEGVVVVDVPMCYRFANAACAALVQQIVVARKICVVNMRLDAAPRLAATYSTWGSQVLVCGGNAFVTLGVRLNRVLSCS